MLKVGLANFVGALLRVGVSLLSVPVLFALLGTEAYGLWTWLLAIVGLFGLADLGLSTSSTALVARETGTPSDAGLSEVLSIIGTSVLVLGGVSSSGLFLGASAIARLAPGVGAGAGSDLASALALSALLVWARCLQQTLVATQQALRRFGRVNLIATLQRIAETAGLILVAARGGSIAQLVQWLVLTSLVALLVHAASCRSLLRGRRLRYAWSSTRWRGILRYSAGAWLVAAGGVIFIQGDRLVVGAVLGSATLGIYAAISSALLQINALSAVAAIPILPEVPTKDLGGALGGALRAKVRQATRLNFALALGLGAAMALLSPWIARVLLGAEVTPAEIEALRVGSVIYAGYSVSAVGFYVLHGADSLRACAAVVLSCGVLTLLAVALGATTLGLLGAVLGSAAYTGTIMLHVIAMRRLGIAARVWSRWVRVPVLWFVVAIAVDQLTPAGLAWKAGSLLGLGVLLAWWLFAPGRAADAEVPA